VTLTITVNGTPAPKGSFKIRRGRITNDNERTKPWQELVQWAALDAMVPHRHLFPLRGPLAVTIVFTVPRPKSLPKRVLWPTAKRDLDKLLRAVFDALTAAGVIQDDGQIVVVRASKVYPNANQGAANSGFGVVPLDSPGAVIEVRTI
jgi:Holliday junction resolvase RusA-like endonuclease